MWPSWSVSGQDAAHGQAELPGAGQPGAPVPLVGRRGHQVPQPARATKGGSRRFHSAGRLKVSTNVFTIKTLC